MAILASATKTLIRVNDGEDANGIVHTFSGTEGSAGYVAFATISIKKNYANQPVKFSITGRKNEPSNVVLCFLNKDNKDPDIEYFRADGNIGLWIQKTATSTWRLIAKKQESYDHLYINNYIDSTSYAEGKNLSLSWTNVHLSSLPTSTTDLPVIAATKLAAGRAADAAQTTANAGIKTITQLYYASNSTTAPSKPTAAVTTASASTYNAWNTTLPTYSATYPYLYMCKETLTNGGTRGWTAVELSSYPAVTNTIKNTANTANTRATNVYGTCSTAAATAAKVATLSGFSLFTNATVHIKFTNNNTVDNPTLNVNSTGAKPIVTNGVKYAYWEAGATVTFVYDGTNWNVSSTPVYANTVTVGNPGSQNVYIDADSVDIRDGETVNASFKEDAIELGQNTNGATIKMCGRNVQISHAHSTDDQGNIVTSENDIVANGKLNIKSDDIDGMGYDYEVRLQAGESIIDLSTSSSQSASSIDIYSDDITYNRESIASLLGMRVKAGTVVATVKGDTSYALTTLAKLQSLFGVTANQQHFFILAYNGDGYGGTTAHYGAVTYQQGTYYVVFDTTVTHAIRINYLIFYIPILIGKDS